MANRERKHELKVFLSDDEHRILEGKFKLSDKRSRSDFIRQLIIEEYNTQLGKIGANINQIAHRINTTRSIYQTDMDEIKKEVQEIWRLQKSMLSRQPYPEV